MDKLVERLVEMAAKFPAEGSEARLAVIPAKALPALAEYVKASEALRDRVSHREADSDGPACPWHFDAMECNCGAMAREQAHEKARAALLSALGGDK